MDQKHTLNFLAGFCIAGSLLISIDNAFSIYDVVKNNPTKLIDELSDEDGLSFSIKNDSLCILKKDSDIKHVLSEDSYDVLNQLLNNQYTEIESLRLVRLGEEIDFSRLDLSDISEIEFSSMKDNFDYLGVLNNGYSNISFFDVSFNESLGEFLDHQNLYCSDIFVSDDGSDIVSYLSDEEKKFSSFSTNFYDGNNNLSSFIPSLYAREINLNYYYSNAASPLDISVLLNDRVDEVNLEFLSIVDVQDFTLGTVEITGDNPKLEINITKDDSSCNLDIGTDTLFQVPDFSIVTLDNVTCSDSSAFSSLDNVSGLLYSDGEGSEIFYADKESTNSKVKYLHRRQFYVSSFSRRDFFFENYFLCSIMFIGYRKRDVNENNFY